MKFINTNRIARRKLRVRSKITGTGMIPRIAVHRSNKYIYAQAIDDEKRVTICSFSSQNVKTKEKNKKSDTAFQVGLGLAGLLKEKKITQGVYDRNIYTYLGRVKKLAEGLREGGLKI